MSRDSLLGAFPSARAATLLLRSVLHAFGWRGLTRRLLYVVAMRVGMVRRRTPTLPGYDGVEPASLPPPLDLAAVRRRLATLPDAAAADELVTRAQELLDGRLRLYGDLPVDVGWPPRWSTHPLTGHRYPSTHWTTIRDDDATTGDIKDVWELSRFTFTAPLVRAYVATDDERWAEAWWCAVEDWMSYNPPNVGVAWRCGQETSLRAIAVEYGLSGFQHATATTATRMEAAGRLLAASRDRVVATLGYALSQRNNHAISELTFLLTLNPGDRRCLRLLREVVADQFLADGSYSQQSPTYQRLAVHALWWLRLARPELDPTTMTAIDDALARSRDHLRRITDPTSGRFPNHGPNDGALLFDLDTTDRPDALPLLDVLDGGEPTTEAGAWLWSPRPLPKLIVPNESSTYRTMSGPRSHLLMRVGRGRHRVAHLDELGVDLWVDGENVAPDPGTYRYTAPGPWGNALIGAEVHNRPSAGAGTPRIGRFLIAETPPAVLLEHREDRGGEVLAARLPVEAGSLVRIVVRRADDFLVVDVARNVSTVVRWNLAPDRRTRVEFAGGQTAREVNPDEHDPTSGWLSTNYGSRQPVDVVERRIDPGDVLITRFGDAPSHRDPWVIEVLARHLEAAEQAAVAAAMS